MAKINWILKHRYRPTKPPFSSDSYVMINYIRDQQLTYTQERELEKVNTFYLQKEAEVGSR